MNNLLLYIQILKCYDIIPLLRHCSVEGDTVLVLDSDYDKVLDNHSIEDTDTIIHQYFNNVPFLKFKDLQFIECPNKTIYYWDEEKRQYIDVQLK